MFIAFFFTFYVRRKLSKCEISPVKKLTQTKNIKIEAYAKKDEKLKQKD